MIVCPSCGSSRIRGDYKPAPLLLRIIGFRALLCDYCNFQFRGFSIKPPKSHTPRHAKQKADVFNPAPEVDLTQLSQPRRERPERITLSMFPTSDEEEITVAGELVEPVQTDLRTKVTKLYDQIEKELPGSNRPQLQLASSSSAICPDCGSEDVKRRQRSGFERTVFSFTDHKAFTCHSCGASFYARLEDESSPQAKN